MKNKPGRILWALSVMLSLALGTSALTPALAKEKEEQDTRALVAHGPPGAAVLCPVSASPGTVSECVYRDTVPDLVAGRDLYLLCRFLCGVHEAGDQVVVGVI